MRIVLDLQACQSGSRFRGIGRSAISLATQMVPLLEKRDYEVIVLLNRAYPEEGRVVRRSLSTVSDSVQFLEFNVPLPCSAGDLNNTWRQRAAELLREHALGCLEPDFIHTSQLVADGWADDTVTSVGELGLELPTAVTQHDLIPMAMSDIYMPPGPFREHYLRKLEGLKRANLLLAVSEFSRIEAIEWLNIPEERIVTISSAVSADFVRLSMFRIDNEGTLDKFGLNKGYLFYVPGGFDPRKNLDRLIEAFASLPAKVRKGYPLVIGSKLYAGQREEIIGKAVAAGLAEGEVVLTDYVTDEELIDLYRGCHLYVFPSLHEGFGLPVLEAMVCGAPVIASNCTGITEAVGMPEALFNPHSVTSIADAMHRGIADETFRTKLKAHAAVHPNKFSWERSAAIVVQAIESKHRELLNQGWRPVPRNELPPCDDLLQRIVSSDIDCAPNGDDLQQFQRCFDANMMIGEYSP